MDIKDFPVPIPRVRGRESFPEGHSVQIRVNGAPVAAYNLDERENTPPAERRAADEVLAREIMKRVGARDLPAVDMGSGPVIDVTEAPSGLIEE
jgi:hypothetical protein